MRYGQWDPYVPVAERRRKAKAKMQQLKKKGLHIQPIEIEGRKIAKSFWGIAWNEHLESFGDYANRIPRGRTYVRNGSVCHLDIQKGKVSAMVSGSTLYKIAISITALNPKSWSAVKKSCAGQVGSLLDLLQGKLSANVMSIVTDPKKGLFPAPKEIDLNCNCPDGAYMCKHIAAVLYGIGARLDHHPELLFKLRGVDHEELISIDVDLASTTGKGQGKSRRIADDSLADVFGIDLSPEKPLVAKKKSAPKKTAKKPAKKTTPRKRAAKKTAKKSPRKVARKKQLRARNSKGELVFTGKEVRALRKKFAMTPSEFALLTGVSTLTINNWEQIHDILILRKKSRNALEKIEKLTKRKAWQEMENL